MEESATVHRCVIHRTPRDRSLPSSATGARPETARSLPPDDQIVAAGCAAWIEGCLTTVNGASTLVVTEGCGVAFHVNEIDRVRLHFAGRNLHAR